MSLNKKRKSDVFEDTDFAHPKKEKWYNEEQKSWLLSQPLTEKENAGRRSSFLGALKRMVSGSSMKEKKNRSQSGLSINSKISSQPREPSEDPEDLPSEPLVNNYTLRKFVQTGEPSKIADIESNSVYSMVTPSRKSRLRAHNSSEPSSLVDGLALSAFRRPNRTSFRLFNCKNTGLMTEVPENEELNMSFAPLAEDEETFESCQETPKKQSSIRRTASKLFGSGKKRTTIGTPNEILSISMQADGGGLKMSQETSKDDMNSPRSSTLQRKMSSAFNMIRSSVKTSPSSSRVHNRVQRSKTENLKTNHGIRKRNDAVPRRSSTVSGQIRSQAETSSIVSTQIEDAAEADLFRRKVKMSTKPVPEIFEYEEFDALVVDVVNGKPGSRIAMEICGYFEVINEISIGFMEDPDRMHYICQKEGNPTIICIKVDPKKPLDVRVRVGVGSGLREVWKQQGLKRIFVYPMCLTDEEYNDQEKCLGQFLTMVQHALAWNSSPNEMEYVSLGSFSKEHLQLMKELFNRFLSQLPNAKDDDDKSY